MANKFFFILLSFIYCTNLLANPHVDTLKMHMTELPTWWDEVEVSTFEVKNHDSLLKFWQSEPRCCKREEIEESNRVFFKTVYQSILANPNDIDLFFMGIKLMNRSYLEIPQMLEIQEILLDNFTSYNKLLHNCANCMAGDAIATTLSSSYSLYRKSDNIHKAINRTRNLLEQRKDISDYIAARLYNRMITSYWNMGDKGTAFELAVLALSLYPERANMSGALKSERSQLTRIVTRYKREKSEKQNPTVIKLNPTKNDSKSFKFNYELTDEDIEAKVASIKSHLKSGVSEIVNYIIYAVLGITLVFFLLYFTQKKDKTLGKENFFDDLEDKD